ncbi:hypothetical protein IFU08_14955 [Microbacterium sp. CFBP 8790]|nr:hypothetical protein [Microbacterium sp. CFBP 8790]
MRFRPLVTTALALVCVVVLAGCDLRFSLGFGTGSDGSFDGDELTVPVLYAHGAKGGVTSQRITAASADGGDLSIDITENDVSGVAPVTQSATWTAVAAATLLTGARPDTAYTFGLDARIDTPGAGAVTAVGVLALYYGTEVQPGVALAGGVTPFGTVSPVAGLPEQVSAAIEAGGIDTILVPAGQRIAVDADGAAVDLDQLAATGGMTIAEVADVASAYAVMTGEDLPEAAFPTPAASPTPLPSATEGSEPLADAPGSEAIAAAVDDARARADTALAATVDDARAVPARAALARAQTLREAGDEAGALSAAVATRWHPPRRRARRPSSSSRRGPRTRPTPSTRPTSPSRASAPRQRRTRWPGTPAVPWRSSLRRTTPTTATSRGDAPPRRWHRRRWRRRRRASTVATSPMTARERSTATPTSTVSRRSCVARRSRPPTPTTREPETVPSPPMIWPPSVPERSRRRATTSRRSPATTAAGSPWRSRRCRSHAVPHRCWRNPASASPTGSTRPSLCSSGSRWATSTPCARSRRSPTPALRCLSCVERSRTRPPPPSRRPRRAPRRSTPPRSFGPACWRSPPGWSATESMTGRVIDSVPRQCGAWYSAVPRFQ